MQEFTRPAGSDEDEAASRSAPKPRVTLRLDEDLHIVGCKDPARVLGLDPSFEGRHLSVLLPEHSCLTRRECFANFASFELPAPGELPAELQRVAQELRLSEQRFRLLFESHPLPLWIYDVENFAFLAANRAAAALYGYERAELLALRVNALWPAEYAAELEREVTRPRGPGFFRVGVRTRVRKDGGRVRADIHTHDLVFKGRPARLAVAIDVTAQQRAERMLARGNRALELLAGRASLAAVLHELCEGIVEEAGAHSQCAALLLDNGRIEVVATAGMRPELAAMLHGRLPVPEDGSIGAAVFGPEPVIVGNLAQDPRCARLHPLLGPFGIVAGWSMPIRPASGAVVGALTLFLRERRLPTHAELDYAARAARLAGIAVDHHAADEEVRRLNAELEERVRQRTAELEAANRELESFDYSIAHDLRSPLRAIAGYSALLSTEAEGLGEEGRGYAGRIATVSARMAAMIDDLLDFSRLNRVEIRRAAVNLSALAAAIAEELRSGEPGRSVEFVIAPDVIVEADPGLMAAVMQNLLANAWKFTRTKAQGRIEFGCGEGEQGRHCYVRDNGVGFDPRQADKLFVPFERLHAGGPYEGSGIGLATVRRVILRHGGRVWAEGRPEEGACVHFSL